MRMGGLGKKAAAPGNGSARLLTDSRSAGAKRWHRIDSLLDAALELPQAEREPFLISSCGDDAELLTTVKELLEADEQVGGFLETPAMPVNLDRLSAMGARAAKAITQTAEQNPDGPDPEQIDRYRILGLLGKGAMGRVYRAVDEQGHEVAIKLLRSNAPGQVRRFQREAQVLARIEHEQVCRIYEIAEDNGRPFIAMQLINGESLRKLAPVLSIEVKVDIVAQAALALQAAHDLGVIHRDVKPSNIMVERGTEGKLKAYMLDFGISRLVEATSSTLTGTVIGTPAFIAPERLDSNAQPPDHRIDLYSLGATLYTVLAGQPPFTGSQIQILMQIQDGEPQPLAALNSDIPADLVDIVERCMHRNPELRYGSTRELAEDLQRFLAGEPVKAGTCYPQPQPPSQPRSSLLHRPSLVAAGIIALLVLLILLGIV